MVTLSSESQGIYRKPSTKFSLLRQIQLPRIKIRLSESVRLSLFSPPCKPLSWWHWLKSDSGKGIKKKRRKRTKENKKGKKEKVIKERRENRK